MAALLSAALFSHSALLSDNVSAFHIDSQVYIHTAQQLLKGAVLYRDVFDHKGPVMYVFECTGIFLSNKNFAGVWYVQWLVFAAGICPLFIYWVKKEGLVLSLIAMIMMISWIFRFKTIGDNLPEIYALGLISSFYYLCLKINDTRDIKGLYPLLAGMCGMALFLLKPNFVILILPCLIWLISSLYKQKSIIRFFIYYLMGSCMVLLPFVMYFAYHQALGDAFFGFWTFNFSYIAQQKLSMSESLFEVFFTKANYLLLFILIAALLKFFIYREHRFSFFVLLTTLVLSALILIGLPGRGATSIHYAIPLAPLMAGFVIYTGRDFRQFQLLAFASIALFFIKPVAIHLFTATRPAEIVNTNITYINQHKKADESLCVLGNRCSVYKATGLKCNTPFGFTFPIMQDCSSEVVHKFLAAFHQNKPDWIVYESQYHFDTCITRLLTDYQLVSSQDQELLYRFK